LIASQRPWIPANFSIASDLFFEEKRAIVSISVNLKNVGNVVGSNVEFMSKLFPFHHAVPQTDVAKELHELCDPIAEASNERTKAKFDWGESIFPNDSISQQWNPVMTAEEMAAAGSQTRDGGFLIIFNGCVTYRSPYDTKAHQSGYSYMLERLDLTQPGGHGRYIIPKEGTVPKQDLLLRPYPFRSGFAN
jgi:hypothetical protein